MLFVTIAGIILFLTMAAKLYKGKVAYLGGWYTLMNDSEQIKYDEQRLCRFFAIFYILCIIPMIIGYVLYRLDLEILAIICYFLMCAFSIGLLSYVKRSKRFYKADMAVEVNREV